MLFSSATPQRYALVYIELYHKVMWQSADSWFAAGYVGVGRHVWSLDIEELKNAIKVNDHALEHLCIFWHHFLITSTVTVRLYTVLCWDGLFYQALLLILIHTHIPRWHSKSIVQTTRLSEHQCCIRRNAGHLLRIDHLHCRRYTVSANIVPVGTIFRSGCCRWSNAWSSSASTLLHDSVLRVCSVMPVRYIQI